MGYCICKRTEENPQDVALPEYEITKSLKEMPKIPKIMIPKDHEKEIIKESKPNQSRNRGQAAKGYGTYDIKARKNPLKSTISKTNDHSSSLSEKEKKLIFSACSKLKAFSGISEAEFNVFYSSFKKLRIEQHSDLAYTKRTKSLFLVLCKGELVHKLNQTETKHTTGAVFNEMTLIDETKIQGELIASTKSYIFTLDTSSFKNAVSELGKASAFDLLPLLEKIPILSVNVTRKFRLSGEKQTSLLH